MSAAPSVTSILRARAQKLARAPEALDSGDANLEVLEFRLAQERYALETRHVREVHPLRKLTPLPSAPAFVRGIVNVRGRILPVLDLKRFFGLPEIGLIDTHRIILIAAPEMEFGLLADVSVGVRSVPAGDLHPPLTTLTGIGADYLKGITAERLIVLDMDRILADPRIIVSEEVEP